MTRLTLSVVLGLGVLGGLLTRTETASAALPVFAANCSPGYSTNYSAYYSPYSRTTWNSYDRYGSKYDCGTTSAWDRYPNSRYSTWDNSYRYTDYSRARVRDAYLDRYDDYRHDHRYNNYRY